VSELLNVGQRTVLTMAADGRLKASRIPGTRHYNFFRDDIIHVLAQHIVSPEEIEIEIEADGAVSQAPSSGGRRRRRAARASPSRANRRRM